MRLCNEPSKWFPAIFWTKLSRLEAGHQMYRYRLADKWSTVIEWPANGSLPMKTIYWQLVVRSYLLPRLLTSLQEFFEIILRWILLRNKILHSRDSILWECHRDSWKINWELQKIIYNTSETNRFYFRKSGLSNSYSLSVKSEDEINKTIRIFQFMPIIWTSRKSKNMIGVFRRKLIFHIWNMYYEECFFYCISSNKSMNYTICLSIIC